MILFLTLAAALAAAPGAGTAATRGHDACTGFIDAVPFEITAPGTWCMRSNLVLTDLEAWGAISNVSDDVVIDCNGHRLAGAAGETVPAHGVISYYLDNVTVRGCDVRNFGIPIHVRGRNLIVEDNRVYGAGERGMYVDGSGVVRRNTVVGTGRANFIGWAMGISAFGETDVIDNTVSGVFATTGSDERAWGIFTNYSESISQRQVIVRNRVRNVVHDGNGYASGITVAGQRYAVVRDNIVVAPGSSYGIECPYALTHLSDNIVLASNLSYSCTETLGTNIGKH